MTTHLSASFCAISGRSHLGIGKTNDVHLFINPLIFPSQPLRSMGQAVLPRPRQEGIIPVAGVDF